MLQTLSFKQFVKTFGPGIMFAGTCIGGSHLVQSTKAGAYYGFGLVTVVLLANIFKYPFFEFASRYTNATGDSILEGYKRLGTWILVLYGLVTIFSMFIITAAIGTFTGGLCNNIYFSLTGNPGIPLHLWCLILFVFVFGLLAYGKFGLLDICLKIIGLILVLTVVVAFFSVINNMPAPQTEMGSLDILSTPGGLAFSIALMGWMPIAVDMSAWTSLWTQERIKQTGYYPSMKQTLLDFNIGYGITFILAFLFLTIGAFILYKHPVYTPEVIGDMSGLAYAKTLVDMFTEAVGPWSYWIISIAAFATMLGTAITLIDGYCRSMERTFSLITSDKVHEKLHRGKYLIWVLILIAGSYLVILFYVKNLADILNLATALSFIIAPLAAVLNFLIVFRPEVKLEHRPPKWLKWLGIAGIIFLAVFTVIYLYQMINI